MIPGLHIARGASWHTSRLTSEYLMALQPWDSPSLITGLDVLDGINGRISGDLMVLQVTKYGLSMDYLWIIYGLSMDYLWIIYGLSMDYL